MSNRQGLIATLNEEWQALSLARQFVFMGSAVLLAGMIVIGFWVTRQIEVGVTHNTATSTALYMDSLIEPLVQPLANSDTLPPQVQNDLDNLLNSTSLGRQVVSVKIWKESGLIVYANDRSLIGQSFPPSEDLRKAWAGEVTAGFDSLTDEEDVLERASGKPLLEMYSPIRERSTGRVIAVAEFYEAATSLKQDLFWANLTSWLVVGAVTISMLGLLSIIVFRGSRTIERQQSALKLRVSELCELLEQNEDLRGRVQMASRRTAEINESYLRRISSDLHDGPAQLLALAALRIDAIKSLVSRTVSEPCSTGADLDIVKESVNDALSEIRDLCAGLSLPELDSLSSAEVLRSAARAHERRTGTEVFVDIESVPDDLPRSMKICIYRFVQEALSNGFRHAGGVGQRLHCQFQNDAFDVTVSDAGPGFNVSGRSEMRRGLGLPGLRDRIESLGGRLEINSIVGKGTSLSAHWLVNAAELSSVSAG
jgi:signal transduction histidine kinase